VVKIAVIPAAGLGTRFKPFTNVYPKEMLPINNKPILAHLIEELIESNMEEVIIIINKDKDSIKEYFEDETRIKITFVYQLEQKGLGHAIYQVKDYIKEDAFAVLLGDDLYIYDYPVIKQLINEYNKVKKTIIGVQSVNDEDIKKYGICIPEGKIDTLTKMQTMIEKPTKPVGSNLAALGRYVISSKVFNYLENTKPGSGGEIQLTDALNDMIVKEGMYAYEIDANRYDTGYPFGYVRAFIDFSLKDELIGNEVLEHLKNKI